ncbi:hypothetical protein BC830DRAFT_1172307 [Chytriomyces sp. MP71]|nr:hypothetical protein BC830DRAFT_1172307 [Chytriomyces sp. MP71]
MADGNGISRYMSDSLRVSKALQAFLIARQQCETQYATALAEACYTLKGACESKIDLADGKAQASPLKQAVNDLVKGTGKIADARYAFAGTMKKNILDQFDKTITELQSNFDAQLDEMEHMQDPLFETYDHYKKLKTAHDMNKQQVQEAKDAVTKAQQEAPQKKKELEKLTQRVTTLTQKMIQSNQAVCEAQTGHDDARQRYLKVLPQFQKAISEWDEMRLNSIKQMFIEIKHLEQVALEKAIEANNVGHDNAVTIDVAKIVSKFEDSLLMKDIEVRKTSATSIRDLKSPTKAGTLYLKRNDSPLSPWSVQYMVLKYNRLYIFDNAEADQPREVITLNRLLPDGTSLNASKSSRNRPKSYSDRVTSDFAIIHIAHQSLFQKASCFQLLFHSNCVVTSFPLEFVDTDTMEVSENSSFFYAEEDEKSTKDLRPSIGKRSMMETSTERAMDRRYYFMPVEKDPSVSELWLTAFEQNGAQTYGVNLGVDRGSNDNFGVMVKFGLNLDNGDSELGFLFFSLKEMDLERRVEATMRLTSANQSIYEKSTTLPTLRTNSKLPVGAYNTLVAELTTPPLDTFHFLSGSLPHDQRDEFYDGYLTMMLALNDPILPAIASLIDREIAGTDDPNILFRGNSVLTKILERFMRILGSDYVKDTIGESINSTFRICSSNGNSFEIDPNRIPETEEKNPEEVLAENWQKLLQQVDLIWSAISVSYEKCPM